MLPNSKDELNRNKQRNCRKHLKTISRLKLPTWFPDLCIWYLDLWLDSDEKSGDFSGGPVADSMLPMQSSIPSQATRFHMPQLRVLIPKLKLPHATIKRSFMPQ